MYVWSSLSCKQGSRGKCNVFVNPAPPLTLTVLLPASSSPFLTLLLVSPSSVWTVSDRVNAG